MKKTALITGGSRGIGLGIATALSAEKFDLVIAGQRKESEVRGALDVIRKLGSDVLYVQADVADSKARANLLKSTKKHFGRLNVLVNNAGMAPRERADILEAKEQSFEEVMKVNLQGPYFLTQAVAKWMIEQRKDDTNFRGCIVNVSSVSAVVASVNRGEYCISKAGISMATKLWATRLGEFDIPVYEVRPGIVQTDMTSGVKGKYDNLIEQGLLVQSRWGTPEDIGTAVAMLVRGDLPYSTGQVITVDGGQTIPRL